MTSTTMKELVGVGKAGAIAEESLMGVRTVQAFNGQPQMVERYSNELGKGKSFAVWKGFWSGFLGGMFFFVLFSFLGCGMLNQEILMFILLLEDDLIESREEMLRYLIGWLIVNLFKSLFINTTIWLKHSNFNQSDEPIYMSRQSTISESKRYKIDDIAFTHSLSVCTSNNITNIKDGVISAGFIDIYKNASGNYHWMILGLISAMCRGLELPALALIFGYVFEAFEIVRVFSLILKLNRFNVHKPFRLAMAVIIYGSVGIGVMIFQLLSSVFFAIVSENLAMRFRVQTFSNLLYQDASYFDNPAHTPGKLITRLASDAPNIKAVIYAVSAVIACIVIGFVYCWQVSGKLKLLISLITEKFFIEFILGRLILLILISASFLNTSKLLLIRSIIAMMLGSVAVMNSSSYFPEFVKARTAAGLLFNMIYRAPKTGNKITIRGNILFDNVKFSYPQRPHQPVMRGLQFTAQRGQTVALVGPSGSGKSTIISMMERFYDTTGGFLVRFNII
uniref:ABC transmembrane type-1 domain-containing protein n=1 Tax=Heterorhabditis bacteriophora TaxID=37862 RepID=A0A1I7WKH5_HETBA